MHFVNGQPGDSISVSDRGLLYGQSLFETIAVDHRQALLLEQHLKRLETGCMALAIPLDSAQLLQEIAAVCKALPTDPAVLRVTVTMGEGGRGYANPGIASSNRILSVHAYPPLPRANWQQGIELGIVEIRLGAQPHLAGIKHGNRLEQIIARSQWLPGWQEAILLDQQDRVIEGTQSNIFVLKNKVLQTPDLSHCGVAGVMRNYLIEQADRVGVRAEIVSLSVDHIDTADEVFVCNSLIGLWPVKRFRERLYNDLTISHKLLKILDKDGVIPTL